MTRLEIALLHCQRLADKALAEGDKSLAKRLGQAGALLVDDKVKKVGIGLYIVGSQRDENKAYQVRAGECQCAAHYYGIKCTHRLAAYLWQRAGEELQRSPVEAR